MTFISHSVKLLSVSQMAEGLEVSVSSDRLVLVMGVVTGLGVH